MSNTRKTCGQKIRHKSPMDRIARAYMASVSSSTAVPTLPGIPSRRISSRQAGCPPEAEGVMAEK